MRRATMRRATTACAAAALALAAQAAVTKDLVPALPGLAAPLPSKLYSGYMEPSAGHMLHYMFMESWSDPAKDPVVVWMNGGPGSSSMGGLFTELGPFSTSDNSFPHGPNTGPYTVALNNHTWNTRANMIYLEQPAGVGFSYCAPDAPSCRFGDDNQADDTFAFLEKFFEGFPEFADNEFYLTAESYGGVYVPTLAHNLLTRPNKINFQGLAIGNPTFRQSGWNYPSVPAGEPMKLSPREKIHSEFFFGHGQFSAETHRKIGEECDWAATEPSASCNAQLDAMSEEIGGYNVYNIYDQCKLEGDNVDGGRTFRGWEALLGGSVQTFERQPLEQGPQAPDFGYLCGAERGETAYLNSPVVRKALHVCSEAECGDFPGDHHWTKPYNRTEYDEAALYKLFLQRGLRVMIYSGDTDACIPYSGTEEWITQLNLPKIESWRPWTLDNKTQMAGYVTTLAQPTGAKGSFLFVTVRGAGHMVPRYRSEEALTLIDAFFAGSPLPGYSKGGGGGHVSPASCRVTTDPKAVQSKSSSGHDSWTLSSTGLYHRINGTYCGPHARTLAADAWAYTGDVTEAACLAACEKVHCTCFDTK